MTRLVYGIKSSGHSVLPPSDIAHLVKSRGVSPILLALPSAALSRRGLCKQTRVFEQVF